MESILLFASRGAGREIFRRCWRENPLAVDAMNMERAKATNVLTQFLEIDMAINFFYD